MFDQMKKKLSYHVQSAIGQTVKKKIVVFESDDWGGIRMPSLQAFNHLAGKGIPVDKDCFSKFDSLASADDLSALFEVLSRHRDVNGNPAIFTFNVTTGNPDFEKIRKNNFTEFFTEPFFETLERSRPGVLQLWKTGMHEKLMFPQYHGREHVQQQRWLRSLREGEGFAREAFEQGVFGIAPVFDKAEYYMAAYDYAEDVEDAYQRESIAAGLSIFQDFFGFTPRSFIPPCYIASDWLISLLNIRGVSALQGKIIRLEPKGIVKGRRIYKRHYRCSGADPETGRVNLVRNCFFEPSSRPAYHWISDCLQRMEIAFAWNKPVIIDTHRLNYIGHLVEPNRTENLRLLNTLLTEMRKRWKDIEFMHSQQLADYYKEVI